jgi:hypothetical protein
MAFLTYRVTSSYHTNKRVIGLILFGIAAVFIALGLIFLSRSMSIVDYGETSIPGIGCDSCGFAREVLVVYFTLFTIIGAIFGTVGIWGILKGRSVGIQQSKS